MHDGLIRKVMYADAGWVPALSLYDRGLNDADLNDLQQMGVLVPQESDFGDVEYKLKWDRAQC